jgi:acyl-CoA thioesterase-1
MGIITYKEVHMKRAIVKAIILILVLVLVLAGCDTAAPPLSSNTQKTGPIVCLGDSLTEGYGASRPSEVDKSNSYPAFLEKKVTLNVINAGISGDTAADGLARVDKDVLAKNPQVVIILLGANDFLPPSLRPASETKKDLQAIINKVKSEDRKIYLASFIGDTAWEDSYLKIFPIMPPGIIALLADYKKIYAELWSENPGLGQISNIWKGIGENQMSDLIHPNAKGYSIMADNIFSVLKPYFAENNLLK